MKNTILAQLHNPVLPPGLGGGTGTPSNDQGLTNITKIIAALSGIILIAAVLFFFLYLVTGGIAWITSEGDKAGLEKARNKITNGLIGLIIVAAAWAVFALAGSFIGIDIKNIPFPTLGP